jgi:hypothetical protein
MTGKGLHGKHCDKWVVKEHRYCDKPATVCQGGRYLCDEHDPYGFQTRSNHQEKTMASRVIHQKTFHKLAPLLQQMFPQVEFTFKLNKGDFELIFNVEPPEEALVFHYIKGFIDADDANWNG